MPISVFAALTQACSLSPVFTIFSIDACMNRSTSVRLTFGGALSGRTGGSGGGCVSFFFAQARLFAALGRVFSFVFFMVS